MISPLRQFIRILALPVLCGALWILPSATSTAQTPHNTKLTVRITGIRNAQGNLLVNLRRDANTVVAARSLSINPRTLTAETTFDDLPQGEYGVSVIHDENQNGQLDFEPMGMPLEGYGHSNNPSKREGPPSFDETKFTLGPSAVAIEIKLINWP